MLYLMIGVVDIILHILVVQVLVPGDELRFSAVRQQCFDNEVMSSRDSHIHFTGSGGPTLSKGWI